MRANRFAACIVRNTTLHVRTFNLPVGRTCPGASAWCAVNCYAKHGMFACSPDVIPAHNRNWQLTEDLGAFVDSAVTALSRWRRGGMLRIHSCGDFYSMDYFRAWLEIARQTPHVRFAAYTRTWRLGPEWRALLLEAEDVPNFALWYSTDPTTEIPVDHRRTYIADPDMPYPDGVNVPSPNCGKQVGTSNRGCLDCPTSCWDRNSANKTFAKH